MANTPRPGGPWVDGVTPITADSLNRIEGNTADAASRIGALEQSGGSSVSDATFVAKGIARQVTINVRDFGATGNGATDDTTSISSAMDAANTVGGSVFFPPGTYLCGTISKTYPIRAWANPGTVTILTGNTSGWTWNAVGSLGSQVAVSANVARNSWQIVVASTSGLAAGDLILIGDATATYSAQSSRTQGQLVQIDTIDSGTQLTLLDPTYSAFSTAASAFIAKVTAPTGARVSGLRFRNPTATATAGFLRFAYCRDVTVDFDGEGAGAAGVRFEHCHNFSARTSAKDYYDQSVTGLSQFGYGAEVAGACAHGWLDVRAQRVRHAASGGGIDGANGEPVNILVTGIAHGCTGQSWDWHAQGTDIVFHGCQSYGARGHGFAIRGRRQHVVGGSVSMGFGGVWLFENPGENRIEGLRVSDVANTSALDAGGTGGNGVLVAQTAAGVTIRNCEFLRMAQSGIAIKTGGLTDSVIADNQFRNMGLANVSGTKTAVHAYSALTRTRISRNIVEDNQGTPTTLAGFIFDTACTDTTLDGNRVHNSIPEMSGAAAGSVTAYTTVTSVNTRTGPVTGLAEATDVAAAIAGRQPIDDDLTAIAALAPANGALLGRQGGGWTGRTPTQARGDLGLAAVAASGSYSDLTGKPVSRSSWDPAGIIQTNIPTGRFGTSSVGGLMSSGRLTLAGGFLLQSGVTINSIAFAAGGTPPTSMTNQWFCLIDQAGNILAKTVDAGAATWSFNSLKTLAISGGYTPTADTPAYAGIVLTYTGAAPSMVAATGYAVATPLLAANANTGLTDPASLTTVGTLTGFGNVLYAQVA